MQACQLDGKSKYKRHPRIARIAQSINKIAFGKHIPKQTRQDPLPYQGVFCKHPERKQPYLNRCFSQT